MIGLVVKKIISKLKKEKHYFVHESSYVDNNVIIGEGTKIWHFSHILPGVKIGKNVSIGANVTIGPNVIIGDNCKIQNNVSIFEGVILEDDVFIGPSTTFTNVLNPRAFISRKNEFKVTILKHGCSTGANSTIICGHNIGEYAFVAAGSVVTKDVGPHEMVYGNPAVYRGKICKCGKTYGSDFIICDNCK